MKSLNRTKKGSTICTMVLCFVFALAMLSFAQLGLWSSAADLASVPMSGDGWTAVLSGADTDFYPPVIQQDSPDNVNCLAAGIVYARTGTQSYKDRVIAACDYLASHGNPGDQTLAWSRETGAYALAADLVEYRTTALEDWLHNMAEVYVATDGRTMLNMFYQRPNNWGTHAFGSLITIYAYLQDDTRLNEVRNYWIQGITGPNPGYSYGSDMSWHPNESDPRQINPAGSVKEGLNIDGVCPDDMRRNGSFSNPPPTPSGSYHWGCQQGMIMAARVLERYNPALSIWSVSDNALYRAAYILQAVWDPAYGGWAAEGDDEWILKFVDDAYGSSLSTGAIDEWYTGKNTGWAYVLLGGGTPPDPPAAPTNLSATAISGCEIDLSWTDNSDNESGFKIERSTDSGQNFDYIGMVGMNVTNYSDDELDVSTEYCYRVYAFNAGGNSEYSNTDCATTNSTPCPNDDTAESDIAVSGTVTGSYANTQNSNDVYESIEEVESGGKPQNRYSYLEHKWTINVTGGNTVTFYLEAYKTVSSDGDDFVFAYSTDDAIYTDMVTVTKTSDDDTYQTCSLPGGLSGTVYIRVKDTDQTQGNRSKDIIYVDHMFIRSEGEVIPPAAPTNLVATAVSSGQIDLVWVDNADNETGFKIERSEDGGQNFDEIDQVGTNDTDYSDTGLSPSTQYCYQVRAYNAAGNSAYSNTDCATTQPGGGPVDDVANSDIPIAGTVTGSYTDTHTSNDVYESIEERESGGKPDNRYSYLEHKWTINVTGGSSVTFYVEAYKTASTDGDDFMFAYSTDDDTYTDIVTVIKTSDDDTYQSYSLPSSLSGTVYIRVKDTDQTPGNKNLDVIYIDHMYIRSATAKCSTPEETAGVILPKEIRLYRNYPNPFNPSTTIRYSLPQSDNVKLAIYDMMGRTVYVLVDGVRNAGDYTHIWEAVDSENKALPSGVYLCRLQVGSYVETMKMMYMR